MTAGAKLVGEQVTTLLGPNAYCAEFAFGLWAEEGHLLWRQGLNLNCPSIVGEFCGKGDAAIVFGVFPV